MKDGKEILRWNIKLIFIFQFMYTSCFSFNRYTYILLPLIFSLFYMFLMICREARDIMHNQFLILNPYWKLWELDASKGMARQNEQRRVFDICFAGETRQLHIVRLMYLTVRPDLEHRVRGENEEIWGLALLFSQTNVGSSAHCLTHTHMETHKEKRCNWLSMIRLFLDPRTLPLIKILICGTILEAVDWYIMRNICLPPVSSSDTQIWHMVSMNKSLSFFFWSWELMTIMHLQQGFESGHCSCTFYM